MSQIADSLLPLVDELVADYQNEQFDDILASKINHLSGPEQFQVKNEVIRLCQSCEKMIDLRKSVTGKCRKFLYKGRVHFLDELAIETFNQGVERYGNYTIGVWEAVNQTDNNLQVQLKRQEQERIAAMRQEQARKAQKLQHILATKLNYSDQQYPVHVINFGDYYSRDEERMNYSVPVKLVTPNSIEVEGVTKDLSFRGLYLRVPLTSEVAKDDIVRVTLTNQSTEYQRKIDDGIEYQVKRIEYLDGVIWLGLTRLESSSFEQEADWYGQYLADLIASNKFVYKVNLDNAIDAALKQGHEQVFFARSVTACLFIESIGQSYRLKYALSSGRASNIEQYFSHGKLNYLPSVFSHQHIARFISNTKSRTLPNALLYCFTHTIEQQRLYFAAFDWQLQDDAQLTALFCGYGAKKESWRVFKLVLHQIDKQDANCLFQLPKSQMAQEQQSGFTPYDVGEIPYGLYITDVTSAIATRGYSSRTFDTTQMAVITQFQLAAASEQQAHHFEWLNYGLEELRFEPRFAYKTKVEVRFSNGMLVAATTADFSSRGIQVILPQAVVVKVSDVLFLSFPLLQKITKALRLEQLPYSVIRSDNSQTILYLQAQYDEALQDHHGVKFFKDLIKRNRHKLTLVTDSSERVRLIKTLKNLCQKRLYRWPFYLNRVGGQLRMTKIVASDVNSIQGAGDNLLDLLTDEQNGHAHQVNLSHLITNSHFNDFLANGAGLHTGLEAVQDQVHLAAIDLLIGIKDNQSLDQPLDDSVQLKLLLVKTEHECDSVAKQKVFIEYCLSQGQFVAYRLYLSAVERVEVRRIAHELEYIHHYAQHKSKRIAELLTRIHYVGECIDITDYLLDYCGISLE